MVVQPKPIFDVKALFFKRFAKRRYTRAKATWDVRSGELVFFRGDEVYALEIRPRLYESRGRQRFALQGFMVPVPGRFLTYSPPKGRNHATPNN